MIQKIINIFYLPILLVAAVSIVLSSSIPSTVTGEILAFAPTAAATRRTHAYYNGFEVGGLLHHRHHRRRGQQQQQKLRQSSPRTTATSIHLTPLPKGISPFEKSISKNLDLQQTFRSIAKQAVDSAVSSRSTSTTTDTTATSPLLLELEFPPLLGGSKSKSQFDDFDNVQELDSNKDWTMQFAPLFFTDPEYKNGKTWLVFPDLKECELARKEWQGALYQAATFTTIEAATEFLSGNGSYSAPWGAALANGMNKLLSSNNSKNDSNCEEDGDAGLLGDTKALDKLVQGENAPSTLNLVIQPGNGGPVEDWINCEKISASLEPSSVMIIVNGALDKVRDGYYPAVFFPSLAATVDRFYKNFESAFYLKPISDKGVYGWLFRVFPEPWQVILQTVKTGKNGQSYVEDKVVHVSEDRPSYNEAVAKLLQGAREESLS